MTEPMPMPLPCGCTVENQHVCRPPWLTEDEWAGYARHDTGDPAGAQEWHNEVCS